jgi:hypothetical protein
MELMFIQKFQVPFGNLEDLAAQPPNDTVRRQQEITLDTVVVGNELDSNHKMPRSN